MVSDCGAKIKLFLNSPNKNSIYFTDNQFIIKNAGSSIILYSIIRGQDMDVVNDDSCILNAVRMPSSEIPSLPKCL